MTKQSFPSFRMPTILCAFHPHEVIQQFCHNKACMLPLCRVCISIHQKQHKTMTSQAILIQIDELTNNINTQIQHQKKDILKKHSSIKRFYRISSDAHQEALKTIQENREKAIQQINRKYSILTNQMTNLYQQKLVQIRTIHLKLQQLENTLNIVKGTFNKNKPMRTVILWQSNFLSKLGQELLYQIDQKIKNQQHQQTIHNRYIMQNIHSNIRSPAKRDVSQIEIERLNRYLGLLSYIIQMDVDVSPLQDIKKSFIKLRTSGISLTQVSILKSDTKRSKDSQILSSTQRQYTGGLRLKDLGREVKLSGRITTKQ